VAEAPETEAREPEAPEAEAAEPEAAEDDAPAPARGPNLARRVDEEPEPETAPDVASEEAPDDPEARDELPPEQARRAGPADLPIVRSLESGSYYLQLAAFRDTSGARELVGDLEPRYPVAVLETEREGEAPVYRVFIGPLTEDERGSVLFWFRNRGFGDAFVRRGDS
jgi:cell division septation protein DedD